MNVSVSLHREKFTKIAGEKNSVTNIYSNMSCDCTYIMLYIILMEEY